MNVSHLYQIYLLRFTQTKVGCNKMQPGLENHHLFYTSNRNLKCSYGITTQGIPREYPDRYSIPQPKFVNPKIQASPQTKCYLKCSCFHACFVHRLIIDNKHRWIKGGAPYCPPRNVPFQRLEGRGAAGRQWDELSFILLLDQRGCPPYCAPEMPLLQLKGQGCGRDTMGFMCQPFILESNIPCTSSFTSKC